jgi:hypothetical protein
MVSRPSFAACLVLSLAVIVSTAARAHAESDDLATARTAIAQVRYDEAQTLLVAALHAGTSSPDQLAEIYKLSATTAIVLGQAEVAEQYFRRWLALEPTATLDESVSPKLREPFVSAQAYMAAHGRLSVKAQRRDAIVDVVIESDPLGMVGSVALGDAPPRPVGADGIVRLDVIVPDPGEPANSSELGAVRVLDEFGNRLLELSGESIPRVEVPSGAPSDGVAPPTTAIYRRPLVWGIAATVVAAGGLAFGLAARSAQSDVVAISADPGSHFASELADAQDRRDRDALLANIGFVAAGACVVTAAVMWITRSPSPPVTVAPTSAGAALVLSRTF